MLCRLLFPTNSFKTIQVIDDYISGRLNWSFHVGVCMDGAATITRQLSSFTTGVKQVASECVSTHCVIHREMLASWKILPKLNSVLEDVVKSINSVKGMPLTVNSV